MNQTYNKPKLIRVKHTLFFTLTITVILAILLIVQVSKKNAPIDNQDLEASQTHSHIQPEDPQKAELVKTINNQNAETKTIKPIHRTIFNCEAGATCYSANNTNSADLIKRIEHLDATTNHNYVLIVSSNSIETIAAKTQSELTKTCFDQKLCIIRNDVQKGAILKDLKRIGEGNKNVFFKYIPSPINTTG